MKKTVIAIAIAAAFAAGSVQADSFVNGGFDGPVAGDAGTTSGWLVGGGTGVATRSNILNTNPGFVPSAWLPGGTHYNSANSHSAIIDNTSGYVDPNVGAALGTTVYSGRYSYRVEDLVNGGYASAVSQSVKNYTDQKMFFAWKAVLEAAHSASDSATMKLVLRDDTDSVDVISRIYNATSGGVDPTKFTFSGGNYYTAQWQIEELNIAALGLSGHDFTLSVLAADCQPTGHFGYVYLDGFGSAPPIEGNVPEPASLALVGLGLAGLASSRRRKSA